MYWKFYIVIYRKNSAQLKWSYLSPESTENQSKSSDNDFYIDLMRDDKILKSYPVPISTTTPSLKKRLGILEGEVFFPSETNFVVVRSKDKNLLQIHVPEKSPEVFFDAKNIIPKNTHKLNWTIVSDESKYLWSSLFLECKDKVRYPLGPRLNNTEAEVDFERIPGCQEGKIILRVSNGFHVTEKVSEVFNIPPKPPRLYILAPGDGEEVFPNEIIFHGKGTDRQTRKSLDGDSLEWFLDEELIGRGKYFIFKNISLGKHSIFLKGTDSNMLTTSISITINATYTPKVAIQESSFRKD